MRSFKKQELRQAGVPDKYLVLLGDGKPLDQLHDLLGETKKQTKPENKSDAQDPHPRQSRRMRKLKKKKLGNIQRKAIIDPPYKAIDGTDTPEPENADFVKLSDIFNETLDGSSESAGMSFQNHEFEAIKENFLSAYRELRKEHEIVESARDLEPDAEKLNKMWEDLRTLRKEEAAQSRKLARRFALWLRSKNGTKQISECEDGLLDMGRLATLITSRHPPNPYIGSMPSSTLDTAVTFLFDYSGSMEGEPIQTAALLSHDLSVSMERERIVTETLGFTTRGMKSLHIVIKNFNQRSSQVSANWGIACSTEHMSGTNDTDAILWALDRLSRRPEARKILVVVSDVQPNASFVKKKFPNLSYAALLKSVIMNAERMSGVEIIGLGIGRNAPLGQYYKNGVVLKGINELGPVLINRLQQVMDDRIVTRHRRMDRSQGAARRVPGQSFHIA